MFATEEGRRDTVDDPDEESLAKAREEGHWYPFVGRPRVAAALQTPWGKLFQSYGDGQVVMPGMEPKTVVQAAVGLGTLAAVLGLGAWWLKGRSR